MKTNDTIAAISTSLTPGGIGIVRLSGDKSVEIADRIYKGKKKLKDSETHTINFGYVLDGEEIIDQVLVMLMRAPRTYTGEDIVEIDCHGGPLVLQRVLALVLREGASPAGPGEFTKRAFLNGKMDLSQAEAVADIIEAEDERALKTGVRQLRGRLSGVVSELRAAVRGELAFIEAALDDPEHYDFDGYGDRLKAVIEKAGAEVDRLIETSKSGILMKSGVNTVIAGRPNAGKSSVYNLLAGEDRAIVTDIAGTTRDTLTEHVRVGDVRLNLTDTAGLRNSDDVVEKIGVERARAAAENAELIIVVIDTSAPLDEQDKEITDIVKGKNVIILLNKTDIATEEKSRKHRTFAESIAEDRNIIRFSAKTGEGYEKLKERLSEMFLGGEIYSDDGIIISSVRQTEALARAKASLEKVRDSIEAGMPEDFYTIDLMDAYEALGEITGESVGDEIIDEIFSRFCMGK